MSQTRTAIEYSSEKAFESEVMPGVRVLLHFGSWARRIDLYARTERFREVVRSIDGERKAVLDAWNAAKKEFEAVRTEELAELNEAIAEETDDSVSLDLQKRADALRETKFEFPQELEADSKRVQMAFLEAEKKLYDPERLRVYVKEIQFLNIDGQPATVEAQIVNGHPDLTAEILHHIDQIEGLTVEEQKNLLSPSISPAAAVGETSDMTADAAV